MLGLGMLAKRLARVGISVLTTAVTGMVLFMATQAAIILGMEEHSILIWICFGFFGTSGIIAYASLSQSFPSHLSGRVTTGVNLLVFLVAFAGQWAIGGAVAVAMSVSGPPSTSVITGVMNENVRLADTVHRRVFDVALVHRAVARNSGHHLRGDEAGRDGPRRSPGTEPRGTARGGTESGR